MPRYNLRKLRGERVIKKKEGERIKRWESDYERLVNDAGNILTQEKVKEVILETFEKDGIEQEKVSLICPLKKERIVVPARYRNCRHLQCFELKTLFEMKTKRNYLNCPMCDTKVDSDLTDLCIDKYFQKILSEISGAAEANIFADGTYKVVLSQAALITPKVIDDEDPYVPDTLIIPACEVKSEIEQNPGQIEASDSVATSIGDGQNQKQNRFGESPLESGTDDEESEYEREQSADGSGDKSGTNTETLINKTRRKENHRESSENKIQGNSRPNARSQFKKKRQHDVGAKRAVDAEKRHKCKLCHYAANKVNDLTRHMRIHTGEKPFKCKYCHYATANRCSLINHERYHSGEKPFKCQFCEYATSRNGDLVKHIRSHTKEKPFKCSFCKFAAAQHSNLINHIRIHTREKPYKCSFCEFATSRSHTLAEHVRRHTGEKPYKCQFCEFATGFGQNFNSHMRTQHKDALKLDLAKN